MTRREAREQAFCLLFEQAAGGGEMEEILQAAQEARDLVPNSFTESLVFGVEENRDKIDGLIRENLRGWSIRRLSKVSLAVLRLAIYEMLYEPAIPSSVSINEAVELAKTYGGQGDSAYVNGVLSSVNKSRCS